MALQIDATAVPRIRDGVPSEAVNRQATPEIDQLPPEDIATLNSTAAKVIAADRPSSDRAKNADYQIDGVVLNQESGLFEDGVTEFLVRGKPFITADVPGSADDSDAMLVQFEEGQLLLRAVPEADSGIVENDGRPAKSNATDERDQSEFTEVPVRSRQNIVEENVSVHRQIIVGESMPAWFRPDPEVERYPLIGVVEEVDGKKQLSEAALQDWGIELSQCERALIESPAVFKLSDISQMGIRFSEHGRWMVHSRLDHSIDVMEAAKRIAGRLELSRYETQLARLGGLLHDVGHIAFAHTGEVIYRTITKDPGYDHDDRSVQLLRSGDLHDIICHFSRADGSLLPDDATREEGINPLHLVAILDDSPTLSKSELRQLMERSDLSPAEQETLSYELMRKQYAHIRFVVKEVADRAYLRTDVVGTDFSPQVRDAFFSVYDAFEQSVRIEPAVNKDEFGARRVYFEDLAPARRLLAARDALYHEYSCNIRTMVAGVWLSRALQDAIDTGSHELKKNPAADVLTAERLQQLGETEILSRFVHGRYRDWFYENPQQIGGCLEHIIAPVIAYPVGALTQAGQEYVLNSAEGDINQSQFMKDLRARAIAAFPAMKSHIDDLLMLATEDYSKKMALDYSKSGQTLSGTLKRHLPDDRRYFLASIPSDGSSGITADQLPQLEIIALELLNKPDFIKAGYAPMTHTIFHPIDKSLYVDAVVPNSKTTRALLEDSEQMH